MTKGATKQRKATTQMKKRKQPTRKQTRGVRTAYSMCRLYPFRSMGASTGIPDGSTNKRLLVDHRMQVSITAGDTGTACLAVLPCLPSPVWVLANDPTLLINGAAIANNTGPLATCLLPVCLPEWTALPVNHFATAGNFDNAVSLYGSSKFRLVTAGWDLQYLGTTLNDSGQITVNSTAVTVNEIGPNPATFSVYSSNSGTNTNYSAGQILIAEFNGPVMNSNTWSKSLGAESRIMPLRKGAHGLLRHANADYSYQAMLSNLQFLTNPTVEGISLLLQSSGGVTPATAGVSGQVNGFDNNWESTIIRVSGMQTGQSFVLDLVFCVEYVPSPTGGVFSLAKPGPPENLSEIHKADRVAKSMPVAEPGSALTAVVNIAKTAAAVAPMLL